MSNNINDQKKEHEQEQVKSAQKRPINQKKEFSTFIVIFLALIAIFTFSLRIPISIKTPWILAILYLSFAPIFIYSTGIMFKWQFAFFICTLGSILGAWINCLILGCGEELAINLIFMLVSRGFQGALISRFRYKKEVLALLIGDIWELFSLFIIGFIWYVLYLGWDIEYVLIWSLLTAVFDLIFVPISLVLNKVLRVAFKIQFLDDLL